MKVIRLLLLFILIVCVGIGAAMVAMQRSFIYHPTRGELAVNYPGVTAERQRAQTIRPHARLDARKLGA